jgi:O-antigen/teichoic acid export membrane protein
MPDNNSREHIRRRLYQNSAVTLACQLVTTVAALIIVPFIIGTLGIDGYGIWESVLAASMLIAMFQTAIRGTLLWKISGAYGANNERQVRRLVRLGVSATLTFCLPVIPLAWLGRDWVVQLINIPPEFTGVGAWILVGVVTLVMFSGINETLGAAVSGYQRAGLTTVIQSVAIMGRYLVAILALLLGWQLWSLLAGLAAGFLIQAIGLYAAASRVCGRLSLVPAIPTRGEVKSMSSYAAFMMVGSVSSALRDQTDKVILAAFASPVWAGYYGIAARLAALVRLVCGFFYVPTTAAAGALHAANDWAGVRRLYATVITVMSVFCGAVVVLVAALYDRILILWIGKTIPEVAPMLFLLLFGSTVAVVLTGTGSSVCKGIGRLEIETSYIVLNLVLNAILTVVLVVWIGAMGTVISSAASWAIGSVVFVALLHRMVDLPAAATRRAALVLAIVLFLAPVARLMLCYLPPSADRVQALISAAGFGAALILVYAVLVLALKIISVQTLRHSWLRVRGQVADLKG